MSDDELLAEAAREVASWPKWLQLNAALVFEDEQERQRQVARRVSQTEGSKE